MPVPRLRMRPWLEKMLESNTIPGLTWLDKEHKLFAIPWKHAARHGWEMEKDASLFKSWAIHTGKYKEGHDKDPKTWKANFRCAMNSLADIEQVRTRSVNKGHQAVRVYKMLPAYTKPKEKRNKGKDGKQRRKFTKAKMEELDFSDTQSDQSQQFEDARLTQENTVDSTEQPDMVCVNLSEVPECETTVEIGPDSTNDLYRKFQVSPEHSPEYEDPDDIIKICQQLELDSQWFQSSTTCNGFLTNELHSDSNSSPESRWSDVSSGDELDLRYTTLEAGIYTNTDDPWNVHFGAYQHPGYSF